jgi:anti-anti-sigma factor
MAERTESSAIKPRLTWEGSVATIRAPVELDLLATPLMRQTVADVVRRRAATGVILDLSETTFVDSAGMATMLNACRRATRAGLGFAIVVPEGHVRETLGRVQLLQTLGAVDTYELACEKTQRRR